MKSAHRDVNKLIEGWDVNLTVHKVWNDSEGSNQVVKDRTIKFHNNICTASVLGNDD